MKIHDCQQKTDEWFALRAGIPTASEFHRFMNDDGTLRQNKKKTGLSDGAETYLNEKIAERILGHVLPSFSSGNMEQGDILESEAIPFLELQHRISISRVGFITTDDGKSGCSPDGIIGPKRGVEIKCPLAQTHVGYLREGILPDDYVLQVHGSIWVAEADEWMFASYKRGFREFVMTVERDEKLCEKIGESVAEFNAKLDAEFLRVKALK